MGAVVVVAVVVGVVGVVVVTLYVDFVLAGTEPTIYREPC